MTPEEKKLIDKMFETSPQDEELKQRMLDDMLSFGCAASKTTIEDGFPVMRYIDPISPEAHAALYNAEHTDSAMEIHYLPITEKSYDGSKLNYAIGYDPFDMGSISPSYFSIWDAKKRCLYFGGEAIKDTFRLPRKLKKKIKKHYSGTYTKRDARFFLDCFKTAKYYGTKILKERK